MTATFHVGDAIQIMNRLPEQSVDLILSSPPFLALRSYLPADHPQKSLEGGSQATPGAYIDWLVSVVEACDRILAPHGSLCFELGDTYAGSGGGGGDYLEGGWREGQAQFAGSGASMRESNAAHARLKNQNRSAWPLAKSLSLIPELFRYTLVYGQNPLTGRTTERWRLRNVIRWVRPNPPVGALGDKFRPATSELMVFCKSAKRFFDLDAVRDINHPERMTEPAMKSPWNQTLGNHTGDGEWHPAGAPPLDWWRTPDDGLPLLIWWCITHQLPTMNPAWCTRGFEEAKCDPIKVGLTQIPDNPPTHPLDWWNIPPGGYQGAHYAVWPPELCVKPIKAMTPEKVCRECGEPRRTIVLEVKPRIRGSGRIGKDSIQGRTGGVFTTAASTSLAVTRPGGFSDCGHNNWRPGLILDPFVGSGTTLAVATGHGRDAIGIDLDERNYDLALERVGPLILQRGEVAA